MRRIPKIAAYLALNLGSGTVGSGIAWGDVTATPGPVGGSVYAMRFNPIVSYSAATLGGHGAQIGGEGFVAPRWSIGGGLAYSQTAFSTMTKLMSRLQNDKEAAQTAAALEKVSVDKSMQRTLFVLATRYHGLGDRLYAAAGVGIMDAEIGAHSGGEQRQVRRRELLPELGYGYQWLYRHGGFVSLGGATIYRVPVSTTVSGSGSGATVDLAKATGEGARVYPALRLGIGAFFR